MGEAEIQSAVEAAAVVFKKVVLQRRAAKKASDEGEFFSTIFFTPHFILGSVITRAVVERVHGHMFNKVK